MLYLNKVEIIPLTTRPPTLNLYRVLYLNIFSEASHAHAVVTLNLYRVLYLNAKKLFNNQKHRKIEPIQSVVFKSAIGEELFIKGAIEPIQSVVFKSLLVIENSL